jgi:hypothetical protein
MKRNPNSQSGILNPRILLALGLFLVGALLATASLPVSHRNAVTPTTSSGALIFVTTTTQKIGGVGTGGCSLQEAIYSSVLHSSFFANYYGGHGIAIDRTDPDHFIATDCVAGTGNGDTIVLQTGGVYNLTADNAGDAYNPYGPTATPIISSNMTIEGGGATLHWTGGSGAGNNVRLFAVGPASITVTDSNGNPLGTVTGTGNLTLRNVYVEGFHVQGGYGEDGGGGGLGAGGAIYVQNGTLVVEKSTFDSNSATGGGTSGSSSGGGGGGLGGSGGFGLTIGVGGGGGGGARGHGGWGNKFDTNPYASGGGGGGGTVLPGSNNNNGGAGGYLCGGSGAQRYSDGQSAPCPGGGGGGGSQDVINNSPQNGGDGNYGGGGGGGAGDAAGANGGFGGGGGAGGSSNPNGSSQSQRGGSGGFGAGGGSGFNGDGRGGAYGGNAGNGGGGAGGGLGGAIFNDSGSVYVRNSTFYNNSVTAGPLPKNYAGNPFGGPGSSAGGAIFSHNGTLLVNDCTISNNLSSSDPFAGGGIAVYSDSSATFGIANTIIANNGNSSDCYTLGSVILTSDSAGNLITANGAGSFGACPGVVTTTDPQLGTLQLNSPGNTPTMAIPLYSSAMGVADPATSLAYDQRGADRPQADSSPRNGFDIGAYEVCRRFFGRMLQAAPCTEQNSPPPQTTTLTMQVSPAGDGTTNPPVGANTENLNSVVGIQATANSGYAFWNWTGPVADPTNPSTTVTMTQAQTVTANFRVISAVSQKTHGNAGSFNIPLPLSGTSGIECRSGGSTGDHQLLVTFANPVTVNGNPQAQVTTGTGQIGSGGTSNGGVVTLNQNKTVVTIPLTNVTNAQRIVVTLFSVNDGTSTTNVNIPMGVLLGDVNGSGLVDSGDVFLVRQQTGKNPDASNFRDDVNVSGLIDSGDVFLTRQNTGKSLP